MASSERTEIVFEIREHLGVIKEYSNGWTKELNVVVWNEASPKYDIRDWSSDHKHMSRGITLHDEEMMTLLELVKDLKVEALAPREGAEIPAQTAMEPTSQNQEQAVPNPANN